jgi:predicted AlkP superfamily pyrophosphatase or phosphodiesterase
MNLKKIALGLLAGTALGGAALADDSGSQHNGFQHVLLISVDGLHALDLARYVEMHPGSALAELSAHGVTFTNARTPANSDSFPGLLALVTGGSPITHGFFYDVSYDRTLYDPTNTTCAGQPGNTIVFDESIDQYGPGNLSLNVIDPTKLPRGKNAQGSCAPVYPHSALKTNTIFEVVKAAGGRTAWADKHPAYDLVNGPSGKGVDDHYTPEITNVGGLDNTISIDCTVDNDALKVQAILNQIDGKTSDGKNARVPNVFGMNFQAVSVGQKLTKSNYVSVTTPPTPSCQDHKSGLDGQPGGYLPDAATPSQVLDYGLNKTDAALGAMVAALKTRQLYDSTLIIISAKHGQSPINPAKVNKPGHFADLVAAIAGSDPGAAAIGVANNCATGPCGFVQDDDVALVWLADQSQTAAAAAFINKNAQTLFVDEVLAGDELKLKFNDPATDSRTPDIIVQPQYGTIYTTSTAKNAEHGGFSYSDTNVALLVSNPALQSAVVKTPVATSQVAPTILTALGLDPQSLKSVLIEHTPVLPGFEKH